eukprot:jgi/Chrzof1/4867/Cz15g02070.t1
MGIFLFAIDPKCHKAVSQNVAAEHQDDHHNTGGSVTVDADSEPTNEHQAASSTNAPLLVRTGTVGSAVSSTDGAASTVFTSAVSSTGGTTNTAIVVLDTATDMQQAVCCTCTEAQEGAQKARWSRRYQVLYENYRPGCYHWEAFVCLQTILLVAVATVGTAAGVLYKLMMFSAVFALSIVARLWFSPIKTDTTDMVVKSLGSTLAEEPVPSSTAQIPVPCRRSTAKQLQQHARLVKFVNR